MCRPKSAGGRRCKEHAYAALPSEKKDQINEQRRQAYALAKEQKFIDEHGGVLPTWREHGFAGKKDIRRGWGDDEQAREQLAPIEALGQAWRDSWTLDEDRAITQYTMGAFEYINALARGEEAYMKVMSKESYLMNDLEGFRRSHQKWMNDLDGAIARHPRSEAPRMLYRSFVINEEDGDAASYAMDNYTLGETITVPNYLSTCMDSDLTVRYCKQHKAKQVILMEIITDQGAVVHERPETYSYGVQDDEREVLLPRNMQLEVVGIHTNVTCEASREIRRYCHAGDKVKVTVIQLVDKTPVSERIVASETSEAPRPRFRNPFSRR